MAGLRLYRSYLFKDKDPIIDAMRTAKDDTGEGYDKLAELSGVSRSTMKNWFNGKTRRPQFATVAAFCTSLGKHGIVFGRNGPQLIGRATPVEFRAHTGKLRRRKA